MEFGDSYHQTITGVYHVPLLESEPGAVLAHIEGRKLLDDTVGPKHPVCHLLGLRTFALKDETGAWSGFSVPCATVITFDPDIEAADQDVVLIVAKKENPITPLALKVASLSKDDFILFDPQKEEAPFALSKEEAEKDWYLIPAVHVQTIFPAYPRAYENAEAFVEGIEVEQSR